MTIETLEAQLLVEKTGGADFAQLCKSKDAAIELERRNYSSVQELDLLALLLVLLVQKCKYWRKEYKSTNTD